MIRVGTSGWVYRHWRGVFYPAELPTARWFAHYASAFRTVEINNTFYRLPPATTFLKWREQAPPGFTYAVKGSRFITHVRKLDRPEEPLDRFLDGARRLGPALGPILFQLPPAWSLDLPRLRAFLGRLPRDLRFVLEFRNPSWLSDEVRALLAETGTAFCMHDMRGFAWPRWVTAPLVYVRFHGRGDGKYGGSYPSKALREWAERLRKLEAEGREVHAYFNNDAEGHAVRNARELIELLA